MQILGKGRLKRFIYIFTIMCGILIIFKGFWTKTKNFKGRNDRKIRRKPGFSLFLFLISTNLRQKHGLIEAYDG